jgi:hypothetical protein
VDQREFLAGQRKAEARLLRKLNWRIIPIVGILYSIGGLDQVTLSNAVVIFLLFAPPYLSVFSGR